ncbi:MAG: aspartate-semialdehyde dehydrogenase [Clostridia bacterium]|nr:aspartate-semialdehyde dehydrogenase [Clostridia bacterium]
MQQYRVGIVGATGMVGQRFALLLKDHPWFKVTCVAASSRSAGKTYAEAIGSRWAFEDTPIPENIANLTVLDAAEVEKIAELVDFVFCAVDMKKDEIRALEERYAKAEIPVVSNNSANRHTPDVPMLIPEINGDHAAIIEAQRKRLGTKVGFIAVKPNCSIQSYVPALWPLREFEPEQVMVCTYQAISGAGKTFRTWPEMVDNVIPYIGGEDEKSEREPLKIFGHVEGDAIVDAAAPAISAQCLRVAASDGHMAAVSVKFKKKPTMEEIFARWENCMPQTYGLDLPSAPRKFLHYFEDPARPQTRLDRETEGGMAICIGRLREDPVMDYKFVCLSHNTLRGAAGGGVLSAEYLCKMGYIPKKDV